MFNILNKSSANFDKLVLHPTGLLIEETKYIESEIPLLKVEDKKRRIVQFYDS
jgi:hypothetical protein